MKTEKNLACPSQNCGLLLDRDGVINIDHGYVGSRDRFDFMPGLFPFLRAAQDRGWRLAVLTNQSGVARGIYTEDDHHALMGWMKNALAKEGIVIEAMLASFTHIDGRHPEHRRDSFWRKPNPGMVLDAIQALRLDPARSAFLGDKLTDMQAGLAGGIRTCLWLGGEALPPAGILSVPNYNAALEQLG